MFYNVLGGTAGTSITTTHDATNYDLFQNIQSRSYWSGVEFNYGNAWVFSFNDGGQYGTGEIFNLFAWAVRSGDVDRCSP